MFVCFGRIKCLGKSEFREKPRPSERDKDGPRAADNLRGQGANIRETVVKLSQALTTLGDHSDDIFVTFRN